jgi:hypothetical protein
MDNQIPENPAPLTPETEAIIAMNLNPVLKLEAVLKEEQSGQTHNESTQETA